MSKKDYIAIARILKEAASIPEVTSRIADYFALDNPRFNREKFMKAASQKISLIPVLVERKDSDVDHPKKVRAVSV